MPKGMLLRSHWWATSLSDPHGQYRFERFLRESGCELRYPLSRDAFVDYGLWFQERAVPDVDPTLVSSVSRPNGSFELSLHDGRVVKSQSVVMATGLASYANRPEACQTLASGLVSHSCDHGDFSRFKGGRVVVIGGGQSAIEYAALLHEAGAETHVVSRRPIVWLAPDTDAPRPIFQRIKAPKNAIAPGWRNWILEHSPYFFYRFPQERKDVANRNYYASAASHWLWTRVMGNVSLHEGQTIVAMEPAGGKVDVSLSSGETLRADHVIFATGYRADIDKVEVLHPSLRAKLAADQGVPLLNSWFESTVPGLYFVGFTSLRAFGPLYRFVGGCSAAARRVAKSIARAF
jgi:hypothetical protein